MKLTPFSRLSTDTMGLRFMFSQYQAVTHQAGTWRIGWIIANVEGVDCSDRSLNFRLNGFYTPR
jgi:hypothetical protein